MRKSIGTRIPNAHPLSLPYACSLPLFFFFNVLLLFCLLHLFPILWVHASSARSPYILTHMMPTSLPYCCLSPPLCSLSSTSGRPTRGPLMCVCAHVRVWVCTFRRMWSHVTLRREEWPSIDKLYFICWIVWRISTNGVRHWYWRPLPNTFLRVKMNSMMF